MSDSNDTPMAKLFGAVHDQIASDDEIAALDDWLRDNPSGQRQYLEFIDLQHEIERQIAGVSATGKVDFQHGQPTHQRRNTRLKIIALAASLFAMVGLGYWFRLVQQERHIALEQGNPPSNIVGIVTASEDALGYFGRRKLEPGSALRAGIVDLKSGEMQLRLESGVDLFLVGPAEIDLTNPQQVELLSGSVTADVPDSVIGFTVRVPGLNVVDLGTTFGVSLPADGKPRVHVFDGVVDAEVEGSRQRTRLTDKQTMTFDGTTLEESRFDKSLFVKPHGTTHAPPVTTGDVRFLHTRPNSVERGRFEHDFVLCFRERDQPTLLPNDLAVSFDVPGHYRVKPKWRNFGEVPGGTLVDSYFIHLDVVGSERRLREGSITFDRPILGVVFSTNLLNSQTKLLGSTDTAYSSEPPNPRNDATLENDSITLSADRRTIRFSWLIRSRSDQVRLLVAADEKQGFAQSSKNAEDL